MSTGKKIGIILKTRIWMKGEQFPFDLQSVRDFNRFHKSGKERKVY